jgi:hypothetical protein
MAMKKKALVLAGLLSMTVLSGCVVETLNFEEEKRSFDFVEDELENRLQKENPELDIDVEITAYDED